VGVCVIKSGHQPANAAPSPRWARISIHPVEILEHGVENQGKSPEWVTGQDNHEAASERGASGSRVQLAGANRSCCDPVGQFHLRVTSSAVLSLCYPGRSWPAPPVLDCHLRELAFPG